GGLALFAAGLTPLAFAVAVTGEAPVAFDSRLVQTAFDGRTRRA
ncbi:MAG: hypothetical protein QOD39_962, partial [Mycobacterium sp.]|nr:hypothetical protein [Mycobacterium sp.]